MYEQFFGLRRTPFSASPHPRFYIPLARFEEAREKLYRCLCRAEGAGLLIGPTGTGKTLLLAVLAQQLRRQFRVVMLNHGRFPSLRALWQTILNQLGQPFRGLDDGELRLSLMDHLAGPEVTAPLALLVDEADTLSLRLMEEIRSWLNVMRDAEPAVRLILAGGTALEERMTSPKLQNLSQRIAARCYLDALSRAETFAYIHEQLQRAGRRGGDIFPEASCQAVYHATGGVPRLINQVCDHALILAFANGQKTVTPELVQEAWSDLQQFPLPWEPPPRHSHAGVIEFGHLSEGEGDSGPFHVTDQSWQSAEATAPQSITSDGSIGRHGGAVPGPHVEQRARAGDDPQEAADSLEEVIRALHEEGPAAAAAREVFPDQSPPILADRPDPITRLQQVTQTVTHLQQELASAPRPTPEVELIFYDWGDPFEETFACEIPVSSRAVVSEVCDPVSEIYGGEPAVDVEGGQPSTLSTVSGETAPQDTGHSAERGHQQAAGANEGGETATERVPSPGLDDLTGGQTTVPAEVLETSEGAPKTGSESLAETILIESSPTVREVLPAESGEAQNQKNEATAGKQDELAESENLQQTESVTADLLSPRAPHGKQSRPGVPRFRSLFSQLRKQA